MLKFVRGVPYMDTMRPAEAGQVRRLDRASADAPRERREAAATGFWPSACGSPWPPRPRTRGRSSATLPPWKPIGPIVRPQRCARRSPPRPCRGPHTAAASASIISPSASSPAARQNRSKLAVISSSAVPIPGDTTPIPAVLCLFMALLASRGFDHPSRISIPSEATNDMRTAWAGSTPVFDMMKVVDAERLSVDRLAALEA
jgi:hypothetical protein